ncbi:MAG: nitrous oxide reductase accessory protein NosL [Desulfuromonadales bacterium]|nr:nitrous oxide reductase accessory protein NosL [Desulfuromonadales bacterium]
MKKIIAATLVALLIASAAVIAAEQDQLDHPACSYCGMNRVKFAHSRMLIEYAEGPGVGTCSIHCSALEFANAIDRLPVAIRVGDLNSTKLIDAEQAVWVLGGDRPGVMTKRAKWAFADKTAAADFIATHGGEIIDFERAMTASYEDMYRDTKMIRAKRAAKKKMMPQ